MEAKNGWIDRDTTSFIVQSAADLIDTAVGEG